MNIKLTLKIGDMEVKLTEEEAIELRDKLNDLFRQKQIIYPYYPFCPYCFCRYPYYPILLRHDTTTGTMEKEKTGY